MKVEEQIFAYKELRNNGQAIFVEYYEDADRIIEALEKQIPKKPKVVGSDFSYTVCPECLTRVLTNYCPNCGQKIDWDAKQSEEKIK